MGQRQQSVGRLALPSGDSALEPSYVSTIAKFAYVWGYPMVNMINRRDKLSAAPEPGRLGGVLPASPIGQISMLDDYIDPGQRFIACPNQDVVYGLGFFALDDHPVVVQVPDFGRRFYVYAFYDVRTSQFGELGSMYDSRPGHYLVVGPDWDGETPAGIVEVIQSPSTLANAIPRIFMDDTEQDRSALRPLIDQVMVYPLDEYTGEMRTKDWSDVPSFAAGDTSGKQEIKWVDPDRFAAQLARVLETVPPLPGEESLYAQFTALVDAMAYDPTIDDLAQAAFREADDTFVANAMQWRYNGKPTENGWNRSVNNSQWGFDFYNRAATARSNMFENRPKETQYYYTDTDSGGHALTGDHTYSVTFSSDLPPVDGFWSLTMYDEGHFFHPNHLSRYSLGTKNDSLVRNHDGSLTLYAGATSPGADRENNWLPAPSGVFSLYLRAYGGRPPIADGSWTPPTITRL